MNYLNFALPSSLIILICTCRIPFQAFDTRLWSRQLKTIAVQGNESIQALCDTYSEILSSEEKEFMA